MEQFHKEDWAPRKHSHPGAGAPAAGGVFWFAGWLFTSAFLNLVWWKWIVGLVIWPYFLGAHFR